MPSHHLHRVPRRLGASVAAVVLVLCLRVAPLSAADAPATAAAPPVVSAPAVPAAAASSALPLGAFFDPSRVSFRQSLTIGASTGGDFKGTAGLYTASFGYKIANPLRLDLDLGAAYSPGGMRSSFGASSYNPAMNGLFLQGLSLDWRPNRTSIIRFSYRDRRSPLQWRSYGAYPGYYDSPPPFGLTEYAEPSRN